MYKDYNLHEFLLDNSISTFESPEKQRRQRALNNFLSLRADSISTKPRFNEKVQMTSHSDMFVMSVFNKYVRKENVNINIYRFFGIFGTVFVKIWMIIEKNGCQGHRMWGWNEKKVGRDVGISISRLSLPLYKRPLRQKHLLVKVWK